MLLRPRSADDRGAYAVLYAVLVVVLVGVVALVIDLGMLRIDRRTNRAAADSAALAGSSALGRSGSNPVGACVKAMDYVEADLGVSSTADNCASTFGGSPVTLCAGSPKTATETVDGREVRVTWPIPDSSPLLDPDQETWPAADVSQPKSTKDGGQCQRIAVEIVQNRSLSFALIWSITDVSTTSRSVGLAADTGRGGTVSPLVVLDPKACSALVSRGGSSIIVEPTLDGLSPGEISVDSDGSGAADPHGSCGGNKTVIDLEGGGQIKARGTAVEPGSIYTLAGDNAYDPTNLTTDCVGTSPGICPEPVRRPDPVTDAPWRDRYNCQDTTPTTCDGKGQNGATLPGPNHDYVDQWVAFATGPVPATWSTPVPCNITSTLVIVGDARADCPTGNGLRVRSGGRLEVTGSLAVNGELDLEGTLAVTGGLIVSSNVRVTGCLLVSEVSMATCASPLPASVPANDPIYSVYLGGDFTGDGSVVLNQTFAYVEDRVEIGSNTGRLALVAPYGDQLTCDPAESNSSAPTTNCFEDLSMWDEHPATDTSPHRLSGNTTFFVDGTVFFPAGQFEIFGSNFQGQTRAQFIANRLEVGGGGTLSMIPNADRSTLIPRSGGSLIR